MDVPRTVAAALADRPVAGSVCLEAGAGVGNASAGLLAAGAERVYAVTDDRGDAETVRARVDDPRDRLVVLEADLRSIPLPAGSVELVTAHGLCNLLAPAALAAVVAEVTRVAAPGCHLVVDDYDPPPADAAVRDLFAVENAAAELATGEPALTFYPRAVLERVFAGAGWERARTRTLLDPVPWTASHLAAHADATRSLAAGLPEAVATALTAEADRLVDRIGAESAGTMYSIALRLSE
jgi:SAM-dependent methyltransferase